MRRVPIFATVIALATTPATSGDRFLDQSDAAAGLVFLTIPFGGNGAFRPKAGLRLSLGEANIPDQSALEFGFDSSGEPAFAVFGSEAGDTPPRLPVAEDNGDWSIGETALRVVVTAVGGVALTAGIVWLDGVRYRCCRQ